MDWLPIIAAVITIICTVRGVSYTFGRWARGVEERFERIEKRLENVESITGWLLFLHRDDLFKLYEQYFPHHSSSSTEKDRLLARLREGTITPDECGRLRELLERQRSEAAAAGAMGAVIAIGGLLLLTVLSAFNW
ncbi:MAG: hypothetical protein QW186_08540 [Candidatus Bathyarchaeia archaeon]